MHYADLRDFIAQLEAQGELKRIAAEVSPRLEMTEICDRVLRAGRAGAAVRAARAGTRSRCSAIFSARCGASRWRWVVEDAAASARDRQAARRPARAGTAQGLRDVWEQAAGAARAAEGARHGAQGALDRALPGSRLGGQGRRPRAPAGADLLAGRCGSAHHLGPDRHARAAKARQNLGIYRQQVIAPNRVIMRWLAHRGGALDFRDHCWRIRASRFRWRWRSAPIRRPCSAR